ncbi:MAG: PH domain-containing protein [Chloroflexi bacterium]|jgi:hypothetical protein|nr:PH domain-containing protein [Chloroflexota bacterium]
MQSQTFRPEQMPRRGEWMAWMVWAGMSLVLWAMDRLGEVPFWAWLFWGFLLFSALSISLGNWMDRQTQLRLSEDGIAFENGLRRVSMPWSEVREVIVMPSVLGKTVEVIGERAHFRFKTSGELTFQGSVRGRTGFANGDEILQEIVRRSGLHPTQRDGTLEYKR